MVTVELIFAESMVIFAESMVKQYYISVLK